MIVFISESLVFMFLHSLADVNNLEIICKTLVTGIDGSGTADFWSLVIMAYEGLVEFWVSLFVA